MFLNALSYPVRGNGLIMIILGAIFSVILHFLEFAPLGLGIIASLTSMGYFGAFYLDIIGSTMTNFDEVPDWPDISNFWNDILSPVFRIIGLCVISFGPLIALVCLADHETSWYAPSLIATVVYACFYFPVATLASQAFGNLGAALPHIVIPGIFRILPGYLLAVIALVLGFVVCGVVEIWIGKVPYIGRFFTSAVALYGLMFQGRLIGLIYRAKSDKLGWE